MGNGDWVLGIEYRVSENPDAEIPPFLHRSLDTGHCALHQTNSDGLVP
jgi:hypothetical protein